MLLIKKFFPVATFFSLFPVIAISATIEEIVVTAEFRDTALLDISSSISVVNASAIAARTAQHLEDVLNVAPNVNFAAGASRGRYIQIRGIGERSQFVDPINPSVGTVIDEMDFSGMGNAGTLYDVKQVEILRGPQGTRFGADALAGMINITSNDPTERFEGGVESEIANYNTWGLGAVVSGPLDDELLGRLAVHQYKSDGFIDNDYLGRDDTNNRDELTIRGKLHWRPSDDWKVELNTAYFDLDNGYDAFSLDNTRKTLSDEPGKDRQESTALLVKTTWSGSDRVLVQGLVSDSNSNLEYGYDEDWSYNGLCDGLECEGWEYSSTDNYRRDRQSHRLELRLLSREDAPLYGSTSWVAGIFAYRREVNLTRTFFDWDLFVDNAVFTSDYRTDNLALYGETETQLSERLSLKAGLRLEHFKGDYDDSRSVVTSPSENLWGGQLALQYQVTDSTMIYGLVSRGYKAGGVNGEALGKAKASNLPTEVKAHLENNLEFDSERLVNWEAGVKGSYLDDRARVRLSAFYMDRSDMQVKGWYNMGPIFVEYIDNATRGNNLGIELETVFHPVEDLELFANIGWLDTEMENFFVLVYNELEDKNELVDKSGRDQAHAPHYQFNLGGQFNFGEGFYVRAEVEGKDSFYFSDSHDQKSDSFELLNMKLGYRMERLDLSLWGRNLTDEDYQVRGFYFGNDPRKFYVPEPYYQYGEPRVLGISAKCEF